MSNPDSPNRFVIRHTSGSKINQVDEFPFDAVPEITLGRSAASTIEFDPDRDELVSREHAKITRDAPDRYTITDLGSRNGTFVNGVQVAGSASVRPGDTVSLGQDGPAFVFDAEPRPPRETRIAGTRDAKATVLAPSLASAASVEPAREPVGRQTVERMVSEARAEDRAAIESERAKSRKRGGIMAGVGGLIAIAAIAAFMLTRPSESGESGPAVPDTTAQAPAAPSTMSPADIAAKHGDAVVFIEASWRLLDSETDKPVYHHYEMTQIGGQNVPMAVYFRLADGTIEPWLTSSDTGGINQPIRSSGSGSGFVISPDGFILTNKHVVAGWDYPFSFPPGAFPGKVYEITEAGQLGGVSILQQNEMPQWVPTSSRFYNQTPITNFKPLKGAPELKVTFSDSEIPFEAELERISPRGDAATIKIDAQEPLHAVELHDSYDSAVVGEPVVIMGYPAVSGVDISVVENREMGGERQVGSIIPRYTVTPANISTIHRSRQSDNPNERVLATGFPDAYQLSTSETGAGNSGGPVFDELGRVIGIFTYSSQMDARVTYAIPIKYGMELTRAQGSN